MVIKGLLDKRRSYVRVARMTACALLLAASSAMAAVPASSTASASYPSSQGATNCWWTNQMRIVGHNQWGTYADSGYWSGGFVSNWWWRIDYWHQLDLTDYSNNHHWMSVYMYSNNGRAYTTVWWNCNGGFAAGW